MSDRVRGVLFWAGAAFLTLSIGLPALGAVALDRGDRAIHVAQRLWGRALVGWLRRLGVRVRFEGLEHLALAGRAVLAANHASQLDIFVLSAVQPPHTRWVAKREMARVPIVGHAMRLAGFVFVDRSGSGASVRQSFADTFADLAGSDRALRLLFFPEGTRCHDGRLGPFKRGAFRLAAEYGLALLPIAIHGSFAVLPRQRLFALAAGTIRVRVLPPLVPGQLADWSESTLQKATRERLLAELEAGSALVAGAAAEEIRDAGELAEDARWRGRREVFDALYSTSRAVPWTHVPCTRSAPIPQYLRRDAAGRVRCPHCGRALAAALAERA